MKYYQMLGLEKEPFSNSPDPSFFYRSAQHQACLQRLELSIRLRRGLNVVIGDVGTGKTTLCRRFLQIVARDHRIQSALLMDPAFDSESRALRAIAAALFGEPIPKTCHLHQIKEWIKQRLFVRCVREKRILVLLIDEGQKCPDFFLEILRELLNYETNQYKLLQIVIFAQGEFTHLLRGNANFVDRINLLYRLNPLTFAEMREMIFHRITQAGCTDNPQRLFTFWALRRIFRAGRGYPRKTIQLCHHCLMLMMIQKQRRVDVGIADACIRRMPFTNLKHPTHERARFDYAWLWFALLVIIILQYPSGLSDPNQTRTSPPPVMRMRITAPIPEKAVQSPVENVEVTSAPLPVLPLPAHIGSIRMQRGDYLSEMVRVVYGVSTAQLVADVAKNNPDVRDPNQIRVGQRIFFPVLRLWDEAICDNDYVLVINTFDALSAAYSTYRLLKNRTSLPLRLMPYWDHAKGWRIHLVIDEAFSGEESGRRRMAEITPQVAGEIHILSGRQEGAVLVADPCMQQGGGRRQGQ